MRKPLPRTHQLTHADLVTHPINPRAFSPTPLLFRAKPVKVTLATTSAVKTANAEFKNFEVKAVTWVQDHGDCEACDA
jgi:hypothetical protein